MGDVRKNQKVELIFKTADGSEKTLTCKVKSFNTDRISLNFPAIVSEYSKYLDEGSDVKVKIYTPLGLNMFDAIIISSPTEPEFEVEYVENSLQIQRRNYLRVPVTVKIVLEREHQNPIIAKTIDLSGGGARFYYEGDIEDGEPVKLSLYIPDMRLIQANGVIINKEFMKENEHVVYFKTIDEETRSRIIKKCFEIQLDVEQ